MPQMRAVMSGASVNARPRRNASKKRGGSKMPSCTSIDLAVPHRASVSAAFALDAGQVVDLDRALSRSLTSAVAPAPRSRAGTARRSALKRAEDAHQVAAGATPSARATSARASARVRRLLRPEAAVAAAVVGRADRAAAGLRHRPEAGRAVRHHDADVAAQLALDADAVGAMFGRRPFRKALDHLEQLVLVDRAAAQLEVDRHVGRDRRRAVERRDVLGRGVDDRQRTPSRP